MIQDLDRIVPNAAKFLMLCRREIGINKLRSKLKFNSIMFNAYIDILEKNGLIVIIKLENMGNRKKNVLITEKGKVFLDSWVEINKQVGVKICPYL